MLSTILQFLSFGLGGLVLNVIKGERRHAHEAKTIISASSPLENEEEDCTIQLEAARSIILEAFKDAGFKGPVQVVFKPVKHEADICYADEISYINQYKRNVLIEFEYNQNDLKNFSRLYAIAGHEAIHASHHHHLPPLCLQGFVYGCTAFSIFQLLLQLGSLRDFSSIYSPEFLFKSGVGCLNFFAGCLIASSLLPNIIIPAIDRALEKDADISSAKKLGTRDSLIEFFLDHKPYLRYPRYLKKMAQASMVYQDSNELAMLSSTEEIIQELKKLPKNLPDNNNYGIKTNKSDVHPCNLERVIYLSRLPPSNLVFFKPEFYYTYLEEKKAEAKNRSSLSLKK